MTPKTSNPHVYPISVASGVSSMSKAKSQTFDPFADLGNLGTNLPGKMPGQVAFKEKTCKRSTSDHKLISSNCHNSTSLAGSSGPSFSTKTPSSTAKPQAQPWQSGRPTSAQNKPWMPGLGSGSTPKTSSMSQPASAQPTKPNYNLNFSSVIGGREERGVRGPGFGKRQRVILFAQRQKRSAISSAHTRKSCPAATSFHSVLLDFVFFHLKST